MPEPCSGGALVAKPMPNLNPAPRGQMPHGFPLGQTRLSSSTTPLLLSCKERNICDGRKQPPALMVHTSAGGTASLLDVGQDELLYICSLLGRQQQAAFPMLCRSIASILRTSGEFNWPPVRSVSSPYIHSTDTPAVRVHAPLTDPKTPCRRPVQKVRCKSSRHGSGLYPWGLSGYSHALGRPAVLGPGMVRKDPSHSLQTSAGE